MILNDKVSLIIPTMNRPKSLDKTLSSYLKGIYVPDEIIIIDQTTSNNLIEQNRQIIDKYAPEIKIQYYYQSEGSSTKARNRGIEMSNNEIVIFSDDDIEVSIDTIGNLIRKFNGNSDVALIAGVDKNSNPTNSMVGYFFFKKSFLKRRVGHVTLGVYGRYPDTVFKDVDTCWAMGFFFAIRKSLLNKWNIRFDEKLIKYAYAEDLDFSFNYCKKARIDNYRCIYSPEVSVKHLVSQEWRTPAYKNLLMSYIHREYISYKHSMPMISRLAIRWSNFGDFLLRLMHRNKPLDILKAQYYVDRYRNEIKIGQLPTKLYN